jgi:alpha-mannosidase
VVRRDAAIGEVPVGPWVRPIGRDGAATLGFASDALYGFDMADGALRPSVVRATGFSFGLGQDVPLDAWRAATDIGEHHFRFLLAPGDADLPRLAAELDQPPAIILAPNSELGPLGRSGSLAALSPASLHVMAIKPADDGTGDLILRVQETAGRPAKVSFTIGGRQHVLGRIGANAIATWHVRR